MKLRLLLVVAFFLLGLALINLRFRKSANEPALPSENSISVEMTQIAATTTKIHIAAPTPLASTGSVIVNKTRSPRGDASETNTLPDQNRRLEVQRDADHPSYEDFLEQFGKDGIGLLTKEKRLSTFPSGGAPLFEADNEFVLGGGKFGEIHFRQSIVPWPPNGMTPSACIAIAGPDHKLEIGSYGDGTMSVRAGPKSNSFLISIAEKHYFLMYFDELGHRAWQEADAPSTFTFFEGNGVIIYYLKNSAGKLVYMGHNLRNDEEGYGGLDLEGLSFCQKPFPNGQ